jgi:hypothetical protein
VEAQEVGGDRLLDLLQPARLLSHAANLAPRSRGSAT